MRDTVDGITVDGITVDGIGITVDGINEGAFERALRAAAGGAL